jgi:hypothetical protein
MLDQVRAWLKEQLAAVKQPEEAASRARAKSDPRTEIGPAPKPVLEAAGDLFAAVGDLLAALRARAEAAAAKQRTGRTPRRKRTLASRAKRAVAAWKRKVAESRAPANEASNGTVRARPTATVDGVETPVIPDRMDPLA